MNDRKLAETISRRGLVAGAVGAAAIAVGPAFASEETSPADDPYSESKMQNPISKYPKPPFNKQTQPWPGLARNMEPKPDHGEKSYVGSGRLAGRKALITVATPVWVVRQRLLTRGKARTLRSTISRPKSPTLVKSLPSSKRSAEKLSQFLATYATRVLPKAGSGGRGSPGGARHRRLQCGAPAIEILDS